MALMRATSPCGARIALEQRFDLRRAVGVGVLGQHAPQRACADRARPFGRRAPRRCAATSSPSAATSTSRAGLEEQLDALPGVGDEARPCAGRFEDARRRREAVRAPCCRG